MKTPFKFHVGQAPFLDSEGRKCGSYQQLDTRGYAIATCCLEDDTVRDFYALPWADRGRLLAEARAFHNATEALNFNP